MKDPRIRGKTRGYMAAWYWSLGYDTLDISQRIGWPESEVYRHLTTIRAMAKRLRRRAA